MQIHRYAIQPFNRGSKTYRIRRYRERAEMLRQIATDVIALECRDVLVSLADAYEGMARELAPSHVGQFSPLREARQWT